MDAAYLQSTLGPLLSEGVAATLLRSPPDPVDFLAHWLKKSVAEKGSLQTRAAQATKLKEADQASAAVEAKSEEEAARAQAHKEASAAEREAQFTNLIATATSRDALLPAFLQGLRELTGASSAYMGLLTTDKESETQSLRYVAATSDNDFMLDKRLTPQQGKVTFSLFGEDEEEEEPEEETDDNGNPIPRPAVVKPLKSVFVPNVLLGPKSAQMHFWRLPGVGSYSTTRLRFKGCVSDEALDEAVERESELLEQKASEDEAREQAEKEAAEEARREAGLDAEEDEEDAEDEEEDEEDDDDSAGARGRARRAAAKKSKKKAGGEEEEEEEEETEEAREAREAKEESDRLKSEEEFILSNLSSRALVDYALCLDTLNQPLGRRFSEQQLAIVAKYARQLQEKLVELDRAAFTEERKRRAALLAFQREVLESNETGTLRSEEEKVEELERISDELEAAGKPMTEEDVLFRYRTDLLLGPQMKEQLAEWALADVFPRGNLVILQAAMFLLGYEKKQVVDASGNADWRRMRPLLTDEFFARLRDYDPRATTHDSVPADRKHTESVAVTALVGLGPSADGSNDDGGGLVYEEIKERQYVLSELLLWVREALGVKRRAKLERAKAKREEAKRAAAAEAARKKEEARAAKEAAKAAAGGAGGDQAERGEDDEEEEEEEEED